MIACELNLKFDIGYCREDFETEKEWIQFCKDSKNDSQFLLDVIRGYNRSGWDFEIGEVTKWEVSEE